MAWTLAQLQECFAFQHRCLTGEKEYNWLFAQYDKNTPVLSTATTPTPDAHTTALSVQGYKPVAQVSKQWTAASPDGIPEKVLKVCSNQRTSVFTFIFNLAKANILFCLKSPTIIQVLKKPAVDSLNDFKAVTLMNNVVFWSVWQTANEAN